MGEIATNHINMAHSETSQTASNWDKNHMEELEPCPFPSHTPNAETIKAMEDSEQGIGVTRFESVEEFQKYLRSLSAEVAQEEADQIEIR
jgi:formate dehydrogenase maturation protein FdhE